MNRPGIFLPALLLLLGVAASGAGLFAWKYSRLRESRGTDRIARVSSSLVRGGFVVRELSRLESERRRLRAEMDELRLRITSADQAVVTRREEIGRAAEEARLESRFALRLCEAAREPIPVRLTGVSGGERGYIGLFEVLGSSRRTAARPGEPIGTSGLVLVGIDAPGHAAPTAMVRNESGGEITRLLAGQTGYERSLVGLFACPGGAVRLRPGDSVERDGVRYRIRNLTIDPTTAEVEWDPGDGMAPRTRILNLEPDSA